MVGAVAAVLRLCSTVCKLVCLNLISLKYEEAREISRDNDRNSLWRIFETKGHLLTNEEQWLIKETLLALDFD